MHTFQQGIKIITIGIIMIADLIIVILLTKNKSNTNPNENTYNKDNIMIIIRKMRIMLSR